MISYASFNMSPAAVVTAGTPKTDEQKTKPEHHAPQTLQDVIDNHREQADKMNQRLGNYDDPQWIESRKAQLKQKIEDLQKEIAILEKLKRAA
jgi:uncharacterized protein (DUF2164 family)